MAPGLPEDLRTPKKRSTWWVGRASESRRAWLDVLGPIILAAWFTFSFYLSPSKDHEWLLVVIWALLLAHLGWLLWCHVSGRDPRDTAINRWGVAHPVVQWILIIAFVVALVVGLRILAP